MGYAFGMTNEPLIWGTCFCCNAAAGCVADASDDDDLHVIQVYTRHLHKFVSAWNIHAN